MEDLESAILYEREVIEIIPDGHPTRAKYLSNLATQLRMRFKMTGLMGDLESAIRLAGVILPAVTK
jgi:hypothetical protein